MLDQLAAAGSVPLGCLTVEELAAVGADERTPFQPAKQHPRLRELSHDVRRAVLATAVRGLMARGLLEPPDERGTLRPLDELDVILGVRRAPAAVVFVGQRSFLAALHGFREEGLTGAAPGISGFLEERIDGLGHHFTVRTVQNAIDTLAALADPAGDVPPARPANGDVSDAARQALRELGPGVTRLDAYHIRPDGHRRIEVAFRVRPGEATAAWRASGIEPELPCVCHVTADGLRRLTRDALCDPSGDAARGAAARTGDGKDDGMAGTAEPRYQCPVCGYPGLAEPARFENGYPSYEICPSCGFEFGYDDDEAGDTYESWRERWIADGMPWRIRSYRTPPGWDPAAQLLSLLESGSDGEADS